MKILLGEDIRKADAATIASEPISGLDLMERASLRLAEVISDRLDAYDSVLVFAGKGNNGGDGLAIARLLSPEIPVSVACAFPPEEMTEECRINYGRLPDSVSKFFYSDGHFMAAGGEDSRMEPEELMSGRTMIVDALLGTGVRGDVKGRIAEITGIVNSLSRHGCRAISIDLPSGLPTEPPSEGCGDIMTAVCADETLTIEFPKLSLMYPSTGKYAGRLTVVPIGLDKAFINSCDSCFECADSLMIEAMMPRRGEFDHKGTCGHALIIAGSQGMSGAAILATGAALRSGCGLVTAHVPFEERMAIHLSHPSAIVDTDSSRCFSELPRNMDRYSATGAGCGLGRAPETVRALSELLECHRPLVLDADALNIISSRPELLARIPSGSVLTPHIGEFSRLVEAASLSGFLTGRHDRPSWENEMDKTRIAGRLAALTSSVIVVKGAHTMTCLPDGRVVFNMTGNAGMAKGGSGDALTGLITGLMARGLNAQDAAVAGVWFHGLAGDRAAAAIGIESMNASDIADRIRTWNSHAHF